MPHFQFFRHQIFVLAHFTRVDFKRNARRYLGALGLAGVAAIAASEILPFDSAGDLYRAVVEQKAVIALEPGGAVAYRAVDAKGRFDPRNSYVRIRGKVDMDQDPRHVPEALVELWAMGEGLTEAQLSAGARMLQKSRYLQVTPETGPAREARYEGKDVIILGLGRVRSASLPAESTAKPASRPRK